MMRFPFVIVPELTDRQRERYERHMDSDASGWHRRWTESIWRRHQDPSNAALSGWRGPEDRRRRLIHFYDEYGVEGRSFVLKNAYLAVNLSLPKAEIDEYVDQVNGRASQGGWRSEPGASGAREWRRGNLMARSARYDVHPEDESRGKRFPAGYAHLDLSVYTEGYTLPSGLAGRPWKWFYDVGLRDTLQPGSPRAIEPEEIVEHLPAQVEMGCGPSTEAGIPHLSTLHRIYGVSRPDYSFVFRAAEDNALEVLSDPERKYAAMTAIYRACLVAEPTPFYHALRDLWIRRHFAGPVITNNFDCLCAEMGLPEISLRSYDSEPYFPMYRGGVTEVPIHPEARSLLVIGVHADRRMAQRYARKQGLKIIYIDPERYVAPDGTVIRYPVESPQDEDLFVRMTAGEAMPRLYRALARAAHG